MVGRGGCAAVARGTTAAGRARLWNSGGFRSVRRGLQDINGRYVLMQGDKILTVAVGNPSIATETAC